MPTVKTNDIETYYEVRGSGPPVVFVHGAIVDSTQWEPQLDALSDEYTTIAYDVRGHGRTAGSDRETYSVNVFADDLAALVEALDLGAPVVCGLSLGGCIAQVYADRYPGDLSGLILADTFGPAPLSLGERVQRKFLLATIPFVRLFGYERVERVMVWFQERLSKGVSGEYENIEAIRESGPTMETLEFAKVIRALASFDETPVGYRTISVPTLILYGEHEAEFVRQHAPALADSISGATVREVPDAGHTSNLDNPDFFTDTIRVFLETADWSDDGSAVSTENIETL